MDFDRRKVHDGPRDPLVFVEALDGGEHLRGNEKLDPALDLIVDGCERVHQRIFGGSWVVWRGEETAACLAASETTAADEFLPWPCEEEDVTKGGFVLTKGYSSPLITVKLQ